MHMFCTICSDLIHQTENIYVTKCGHIFHYHCLGQWIERSKTCPQCRNKVSERCMFRVYPTASNASADADAATLQARLDDAQLQLRQRSAACRESDARLDALAATLKKHEEMLKASEKKLLNRESTITALKEQLEYVKIQNKETQRLKQENEELKKNVQLLNSMEKVLNAGSEEVEQMLEGYADARTVATFATALKRALCESEARRGEAREQLTAQRQQLAAERAAVGALQRTVQQLEDKLSSVQSKYEAAKKRKAADEPGAKAKLPRSELVRLEDASLNTTRLEDASLNTTRLEDASLNTTRLEDASLNTTRIEDASLNTVCLEDTSLNTARLDDTAPLDCDSSYRAPTSPYLSLRRGSVALSALRPLPLPLARASSVPLALKPSEFTILKSSKCPWAARAAPGAAYDGLGGHARPSPSPSPSPSPAPPAPPARRLAPRPSARHRLQPAAR